MSDYNQLPYKKSNSANRFIVVILIISILMAVFLNFIFSYEKSIEQTGFKAISAYFTDKILVVKSQWLMLGKPESVKLKVTEKNQPSEISIYVNQLGWVDSSQSKNVCEDIWLSVMEKPLTFFNEPIKATLIKNQLIKNNNEHASRFWGHYCRYSTQDGRYFDYDSHIGSVILANE